MLSQGIDTYRSALEISHAIRAQKYWSDVSTCAGALQPLQAIASSSGEIAYAPRPQVAKMASVAWLGNVLRKSEEIHSPLAAHGCVSLLHVDLPF